MNTEEFHRKLTAILSADVQGYSRLMGEDEESTVRTLTAYRTLMSSLIRDHRGQVVDTPGDNLLAKFDSGTDAVRCAVEIQEELRIRNSDLPENRKMLFRIGINLGDVIEEGNRIYGDGIKALALDPDFALAWVLKADMTGRLLMDTPADQYDAVVDVRDRAIQRAFELEPNLPGLYRFQGLNATGKGDWIDAELNYRKASELIADPSLKYTALDYHHYLAVGDFNKLYEILKANRTNNPLSPAGRAFYILSLGLIGDRQEAEEEYERCRAMFGDQWFWGNITIALIRIVAGDNSFRDEVKQFWPLDQELWDNVGSPEDALAELSRFYAGEDNLTSFQLLGTSLCAAYFGDPEFALDAMEKALRGDRSSISFVWNPVYHEVRQLPRFKELVREIGLVDYWEKFGWPDICHPTDDGDFVCD